MIIQDLFSKIPFAEILSGPTVNVSGVATDSNLVEPGDLYIPLIQKNQNGYKFIAQAFEKGASAVAGDEVRSRRPNIASIYLPQAHRYVPFISSNVYGNPSDSLKVIGITGTHGKTATAHIVEAILRSAYHNKVGSLGTASYSWGGSRQDANLTTPEAPYLQRMLRKMVEENVGSVVIECSSQGIEEGRLDSTQFDIAIFTNITHDQTNFHGNFVEYRNTKWKLFSSLLCESSKKKKCAIFNIDDPTGRSWFREYLPGVDIITYSIDSKSRATVYPESYHLLNDGIKAKIRILDKVVDIHAPMIGISNLQNILAAFSTTLALRLDFEKAAKVVSQGVEIPERMKKTMDRG